MRIAIIIPRLASLGPVKVMQALTDRLSEYRELSVKVFYLDKESDPDISMKVPVFHYPKHSFSFESFDIVHTNGFRPDLLAFLNRGRIKCHISTIHNAVFNDLAYSYNLLVSWIFGHIWLLILKNADRLVCVSGTLKSYYEKWYSSSILEVIYNGISQSESLKASNDEVLFKIQEFHSKGFRVAGIIGMLTKRKGVDQILRSLCENKDFSLVIIGRGKTLHSLKELSKNLNIEDRTFFCGFRPDASKYLKYFDLFFMPSRSEGFGLALVEAVQQKVPVICSDIPVFRELFNEHEVTFFNPDNNESIEHAYKEAISNGNEKIEAAYSKYMSNYTDQLMADRYYQVYESLVKSYV